MSPSLWWGGASIRLSLGGWRDPPGIAVVPDPPPSSMLLNPLPSSMVPHPLPGTMVPKPRPSAMVPNALPSSTVLHSCGCHQGKDRSRIRHLQARASLRGSGQGRRDADAMPEGGQAAAGQSIPVGSSPPCRPGGRAARGAAGGAESRGGLPACRGVCGPTAVTQPRGCQRSPPAPRLLLLLGALCRSPRE